MACIADLIRGNYSITRSQFMGELYRDKDWYGTTIPMALKFLLEKLLEIGYEYHEPLQLFIRRGYNDRGQLL